MNRMEKVVRQKRILHWMDEKSTCESEGHKVRLFGVTTWRFPDDWTETVAQLTHFHAS